MNTIRTMTGAECAATPATQEDAGFGSLHTDAGNLPLRAMAVDARITGLVARVELRQTFVNCHDMPLQATYIFPLPSRAAVDDFRLRVGGREVRGLLKERAQARADYDQAIQAGKRAAIAEQERPDVFTMRVGNLMPGEHAEVILSYNGPLQLVDAEATFRFPLVVAPRFIPGRALAGRDVGSGVSPDTDVVPDASRITPPVLLPGHPNPVALDLRVELNPAGLAIGEPRVSLHSVGEPATDGGLRILRLQPGERLDRDFILRFDVLGSGIGDSLVLQPDAAKPGGAGHGTFLLTVTPPSMAAVAEPPRDVVFVVDRSGSMSGWKMVAARRALARMLDTLGDADRLAVLAFDDRIEVPHEGLLPATDRQRYQAIEFLAKVEARGGTLMLPPLQQAMEMLRASDAESTRQRVLVLLTDGQVGNEDQLLRDLNLDGTRVFTVGIDRAVNEGFLRRFAQLGGGEFELVETEQRLDEVLDRMHRRICRPVLTDLSLRTEGLDLDFASLQPARLPDLFAGSPLLLFGRYRSRDADPQVVLQATSAAGQAFSACVSAKVLEAGPLASLWARSRIRALEDRYAIAGTPALSEEIVRTSLEFGVLSRFTAFVAVDSEVVNEGGDTHQVIQPVEPPDGWAVEAACGAPAPAEALFCDAMESEDLEIPQCAPGLMRRSSAGGVGGMVSGVADLLGSVAGHLRPKRRSKSSAGPSPSRTGDDPGDDRHQLLQAVVKGLAAGSCSTEFVMQLRELLRRLLEAPLADDLRTRLSALRDELDVSGLHSDLAARFGEVFAELLAVQPRDADFWR